MLSQLGKQDYFHPDTDIIMMTTFKILQSILVGLYILNIAVSKCKTWASHTLGTDQAAISLIHYWIIACQKQLPHAFKTSQLDLHTLYWKLNFLLSTISHHITISSSTNTLTLYVCSFLCYNA